MLSTMYEVAGTVLEQIAPEIRGKGKTILDMTNPFLKRPDGYEAACPRTVLRAGSRCTSRSSTTRQQSGWGLTKA